MKESTSVWTGVALVAVVGGVVAALLYTDRGRHAMARMERSLDDIGHSLQQLRGAVRKAGVVAAEGIDVAAEGMGVVADLIGAKSDRRREAGAFEPGRGIHSEVPVS